MLAEYAKAGKFETGAVANLNHKGTIEDPYDISDAIKLANSAEFIRAVLSLHNASKPPACSKL